MNIFKAIYKLVAPTLSNGDSHPLLLDASGNLKVNVNAGSVGSSFVDDAVFTPGTTTLTVVGGEADETGTDSVDEGDGGAFRMSLRRALKVDLDTKISGEDQTNDVMKVEGQFTGTNCTADTLVKSGAGLLHKVVIYCKDSAPTAGTIILYDNTAESGTEILHMDVSTTFFNPIEIGFNRKLLTGLYVGFTTVADVRLEAEWR